MSAIEEWRPIADLPGYEVSNLGRVMSYKAPQPREVAQQVNKKNGYLYVHLYRDGARYARTVHKLVARAFHGPYPDDLQVRHLDGTRTNNRADNLLPGTAAENAQDTVRHGRCENANKTHCKRGHPFDEANTGWRTDAGGRYCLTCNREVHRPKRDAARRLARTVGVAA